MKKLYRVVSQAELSDLRQCGYFRAANGSMDTKWFAERLEDAVEWGRRFEKSDGIPCRWYVMIEVSQSLADEFDPIGRVDGVGMARCARLDQLDGVKWVEVFP